MIKKLVLVFIALFAIQSYGQDGTASPYSFYGIGSLKFKGSVENRSMGGLGVYKDSIHINFQNPATFTGNNLTSFNNESRPVKFTVGGSFTSTSLKTETSSDKAQSSTFNYLALSVPVGKFGFGFGLLPYTSVGYELETLDSEGRVDFRYFGDGGVNKAFFSLGYQINNALSIGVEMDYDFGNIRNNTINIVFNDSGEPLDYFTAENNRSDISGLNFNLGLHYQKMINSKLEFQGSVTYAPEAELTSRNQRIIFTDNGTEESNIEVDLAASNLEETKLTLPSKFSFGAGLGEPRKWFAGVEYVSQNTSEFFNPFYGNVGATFEDASKLSIGGFYIPEYNSFSKYWKRATYRAGLRFENTGLNINNQSIKEFGMSFGVGLPVGNVFSNANIGLELGQRGTTNANLVKENFISFQLSLSLNDRWFQKRKYD
ncbi:hypothetical protein [Olleya sp. YS]|uniref:hypothetical protein n=1 Tax=Olleya sp. YS TaxID=3028318 RepID=UPI0024340E7E|nr:hypothetical protein [Olleya sp. YS]WGD33577.1 hypothetical protein Ollyesu_07275 [Olleya sp. YS]